MASVHQEERRRTPLPFHRPWIDSNEIQEVLQILSVGAPTAGAITTEFEEAFARFVGSRHAVAVKSSVAALHIALDVAGVQPGDEVISSTYAFGTMTSPIVQLGAKPILADITQRGFTLDPAEVRSRITPQTRVIIPAHFTGMPCDMDEILDLAARHDIRVVEDASHALPARYKGRMVGSMGDLTVFSLGTMRSITAGEGGVITTDRDDYVEELLGRRRRHTYEEAWDQPLDERVRFHTESYHRYTDDMTDLNAAIARQQLKKVDMFHAIRIYHANLYALGLSDLPELALPEPPNGDVQPAWYLYVVELQPGRLSIDRDTFVRLLWEENVRPGVHVIPLHLHRYFRDAGYHGAEEFPNALRAYEQAVSLPLYPRMTESDVWDVIRAVRRIVERHRVHREA